MDAGEGGMAGSPDQEHRIPIPDDNAGGSGVVTVGPGIINEEVVSSLSEPTADDQVWIREMVVKIDLAFPDSALQKPSYLRDETKANICKLPPRDRISQPGLETKGGISEPSVVTIGPFHRRGDEKSISDKEKLVIVKLMNRLCGLDLGRCLVKIRNQIASACDSYDELDELESSGFKDNKNSFAEMLLLDSYFILFTLTIQIRKGLAHYTLAPPTPNKFTKKPLTLTQNDPFKFLDIIFNKVEMALDLLIFDNQIPFFVIEELYKELELDTPLHKYALEFFETIHPRSARHSIDQHSPRKFLHLLDLFHWSRVPQNKYSLPQQQDSIDRAGHTPNAMEREERATAIEKEKPQQLDSIYWDRYTLNAMERKEDATAIEKDKPQQPDSIDQARDTPNARELTESAIVFEKKTSGSSLDITFQGRRWSTPITRVLDIPELHIHSYSSFIFHNLIAFEIQSPSRGRCTMAFSALMRNLLRREEDVKLLRQRGILVRSSMDDSQLIDLFARLSRLTENHQMPSDLSTICRQVESHHKHPVNQFWGSVKVRYFPSPLVTLTVFGAILLFIPTLLQTIYAML